MEGDSISVINGNKKGFWTEEEDRVLIEQMRVRGEGKWNRIAKSAGLKRSGKGCKARWMNYLSPSVKRDAFSEDEDDLIIRLHNLLGNRWSLIAGRLPGRRGRQVKNHWNSYLSKKVGLKHNTQFKASSSSATVLAGAEAKNVNALNATTEAESSSSDNGVKA